MRNEILDEAEKYYGPRTCPECGHQFPFGLFVRRFIMSYGLSNWPCHNCHELLKCDFIKVYFYWLLGLLPFGFLFSLLMDHFDLGFFNIIFVAPFFLFYLSVLYYVKFERY